MNTQELRRTIADIVEEEPEDIGPDTNLFELGMDSISLMRLVNTWRKAGVEVSFAELAQQPTLAAWSSLVDGRAAQEDVVVEEVPVEDGPFPLGLMQHAYWVGREDGQQLGGVAAHLYTEFDGAGVDPDRLRTAFEALVARHDMLRAKLTDNGEQVVETTSGWRGVSVHDLRGLDAAEVDARLEETRTALSHQKLDVESGEVFSTALSLLPDGRTRLHLDVDMVAADAVSYRILLAELASLYRDPEQALADIGYSYRQYRAERPKPRRAASESWWSDRLADLPGAPLLPLADNASGPACVARRHFTLAADDRTALAAAAQRRGLTPAMVVATAFAEVIGRWSAEPRFLLNVPLFDRDPVHEGVDRVVGDFSSSVLLEIDLGERKSFAERAKQVQARMHQDAAHADYSGVEVLRDLTRRDAKQVLAPVVFTSALSLGELFDTSVRETFGEAVWIISQGPQVLLDAQITEVAGGLLVNWDTREEQFAADVLDAMFDAFDRLVHRLSADDAVWDAPVWESTEKPVALACRVVDTHGDDRPARVAGDLLLAQGDGWYRTGERARFRSDGTVEFLGRRVEESVVETASERVAPRTDLERSVALVWREVLRVDEVGVTDEFFALGGDSVLAASIITRLREGLDTDAVSVRMLFAAPTIEGLVARMLEAEDEPGRLDQVAEIFLEIESMTDEDVQMELTDAGL